MQMRKYLRGVTLMELMIVVVVIGVLAAVAFPSYRQYVNRAKRAEAKAALLKCAINQEKFYLSNSIFSDDLVELGFGTPFKTGSGTHTLSVLPSPPSADNFTCTATLAAPSDETAVCNSFTIDGRGNRTSAPELDCWTRKN